MPTAVDIPTFASSQITLLDGELRAEAAETSILLSTHAPSVLARAGLAITNLSISSQRTGLGGKTLLELEVDAAIASSGKELPEHGIRVGDIVSVVEQPKGAERKMERESMERKGVQGVVVKVQREGLVVALDKDEVEVPGGRLWLWVSCPALSPFSMSMLMRSLYVESSLQTMSRTEGIATLTGSTIS